LGKRERNINEVSVRKSMAAGERNGFINSSTYMETMESVPQGFFSRARRRKSRKSTRKSGHRKSSHRHKRVKHNRTSRRISHRRSRGGVLHTKKGQPYVIDKKTGKARFIKKRGHK